MTNITLTAMLLAWTVVTPAFAQAQQPAEAPARTDQTFSAWLNERQFDELLARKLRNADYPIEIEGKNHERQLYYRAKFARQPAEKFFRFEAHKGLTSFEFENTGTMLKTSCYQAIHTYSFANRLGEKRHCGIWVRTFPMLVRTLATSQDDGQRTQTVLVLLEFGKNDVEVQGVLLRTLKRCNSDVVRRQVAKSLPSFSIEPARSAAALVTAFKTDTSQQVRRAAAASLGYFPAQAAQTVPPLFDALESDDQAMRAAAAGALAQVYTQVGILTHLQVDPNDSQQAVPVLVRLLTNHGPKKDKPAQNVQQPNIQQIPVINPDLIAVGVRPAVVGARRGFFPIGPALLLRLDASEPLREGALKDLASLGADAASAVPSILTALETDGSPSVRNAAVHALSQIAPHRPEVVTALITALEHDAPCHDSCVQALQEKDSWAIAFPILERTLANAEDDMQRMRTVTVLQVLGKNDIATQRVLLDTLKLGKNEDIRALVARRLKPSQAAPDQAVAALVTALKTDSSPRVRITAAGSLGRFTAQAAQSVPPLFDELESDDQAMRETAAGALSSIYREVGLLEHLPVDPADSQQAVTVLIRLLRTREPARKKPAVVAPARDEPKVNVQGVNVQGGNVQRRIIIQRVDEKTGIVRGVFVPEIQELDDVRFNRAAIRLLPANARQHDATEFLRDGVLQDLARLGPDAASAAPDVLTALESDPSSRVRSAAALALAKIAPQHPDVVTALMTALERDKPCHVSYVEALRESDVWELAFPILLRTLATSSDDTQRGRTVLALLELGRDNATVQSALLDTLKRNTSEAVRTIVAHCLPSFQMNRAQSVAALVAALKTDPSSQVRGAVAMSLGQFPDQAAQSVPLLIEALESDDPILRSAAASTLARLYRKVGILEHLQVDPADSGKAVAVLMHLLNTQVPERDALGRDVQELEAFTVGPFAAAANAVIVQLNRGNALRRDETEVLHVGVIQDLARLGAGAEVAAPIVLKALEESTSSKVRNAAALALVKIAPSRLEVAAALLTAMEHDKPCRANCVQALQQIGPQGSIPVVLRVFKSSRNRVMRGELIRLLAVLGTGTPEAAATLSEIYQAEENLILRTQAAMALVHIAPSTTIDGQTPADACYSQAMKQFASSDPFTKAEAVRALGVLGPRAKPAVDELIEATKHASFSVQNAAVTALSQMGPDAHEAVPAITALLHEKTWRLIPPVAAQALGNMGPRAKEAIPALRECLESSHPGLRDAAAEALKKIEQ